VAWWGGEGGGETELEVGLHQAVGYWYRSIYTET
jgi:hypothetical protein